MRLRLLLAGLGGLIASAPAAAETVIIYTNPMTMQRHTVIVDSDGPDRAFLCMLPPGDAGCRAVAVRRERR